MSTLGKKCAGKLSGPNATAIDVEVEFDRQIEWTGTLIVPTDVGDLDGAYVLAIEGETRRIILHGYARNTAAGCSGSFRLPMSGE